MMNHLQRARDLAARGLSEQIDWVDQFNREFLHDELLTLDAEYARVVAQAEGEPITDIPDGYGPIQ